MRYKLLILFFGFSLCLQAQQKRLVVNVGHAYGVLNAVLSPNGKYILTGSFDQTARLWQASSGKLLRVFKGYKKAVSVVSFSPDGQFVIINDKGNLQFWNITSGKRTRTIRGNALVTAIAFSPDGKFMAVGHSHGVIRIWHLTTKQLYKRLKKNDEKLDCLTFSPDGKFLVSGSFGNRLNIWEIATQKPPKDIRLNPKYHSVTAISYSPDGQYIYAKAAYNKLYVLDTKNLKALDTIKLDRGELRVASFSTDGRYLATVNRLDSTLTMWNTKTRKLIYTLSDYEHRINTVKFSADGKLIITGGEYGQVKIRRVKDGQLVKTLPSLNHQLESLNLSKNQQWLAVGGWMGTSSQLWSLKTGKLMKKFPNLTLSTQSVQFSADSKELLVATQGSYAKIWEVSTGKHLRDFIKCGDITRLLLLPDGKKVLAFEKSYVSNYDLKLWDYKTARLLTDIAHNQKGGLLSVCVTQDGKYVLCTNLTGRKIHIWNANKGIVERRVSTRQEVTATALSPRDQYMAVVEEKGGVEIFNFKTGKLVGHFKNLNNLYGSRSVCFSSDASKLLVSDNQDVVLLDIAGNKVLHRMQGHCTSVNDALFFRNDRYILSASDDNTVRLWETKTGKLLCTLYACFESPQAYLLVTPEGKYDGSPAAFKYLHYVKGKDHISPLPKNDPNYVKGLWKKILDKQKH